MTQFQEITGKDSESIRELLSCSGYANSAIEYFLDRANMGSLPDADQITELTIKTLKKAIEEYRSEYENNLQGE